MNEWQTAKAQVDYMEFPADYSIFKQSDVLKAHHVGKERHPVTHYLTELKKIGGFPLEASYTICEECPQRVISRKFYLFNNAESTVFIKELVGSYGGRR